MEQSTKKVLSVLIIAKYDPTFDWVHLTLQEQHYKIVGRVDSIEEALKKVQRAHPDIVLADTSVEGVFNTAWLRELGILSPGTLTLVIATTSEMDFVRESMLAGAQGFLLKPFDQTELSRSIEQVHQMWLQRHTLFNEAKEKTGSNKTHSIAVFSPKGGTGVTTLAVNLAIAIKQQTDVPVLLIDADFNTADVDVFLNVFNEHSILDLVQLDQGVDPELLESITADHSTGIRVLQGDSNLQFIDAPVDPGQMSSLMEGLIANWDGYIVINTGNSLDRWTVETLDAADTVLLTTTPELPSLRAMRNFLELAEAHAEGGGKWQLVMNAYQSQKILHMSDIEELLRYPIKVTISQDVDLVSASINRGAPLLVSHGQSSVARDIIALAKQLVETYPHPQKLHPVEEQDPMVEGRKKRFSFRRIFTHTFRPVGKLESPAG